MYYSRFSLWNVHKLEQKTTSSEKRLNSLYMSELFKASASRIAASRSF